MSNEVQGLCFKARFGCPKRKAVAVAMADHAHDDGTHIWPSIKLLAKKTDWSERTVQRALRELASVGLITLVKEGGHGAKSTNEYSFDMDVLRDLASGAVKFADIEGDQQTPYTLVRVTASPIRVTAGPNKGVCQTPEPLKNHKKPSGAGERASEDARPPTPKRAVPQFTIRQADSSWAHWIAWLTDNDRRDLVVAAQEARQMVTASRWPTDNSPLPRIDGGPALERRKTGEAA